MGLLDGALGALLGGNTAGTAANNPMAQVLTGLLQQHGGLGGLVAQLSQGGLANEVQSWIGSGPNQSVSGAQIASALGSPQVMQIAQKLGINPTEASAVLAQVLPHLIDHLTPTGQVTPAAANGATQPDVIGGALKALAGRLLG